MSENNDLEEKRAAFLKQHQGQSGVFSAQAPNEPYYMKSPAVKQGNPCLATFSLIALLLLVVSILVMSASGQTIEWPLWGGLLISGTIYLLTRKRG